jgi:predicted PurR-regulated permease PerM
MSSPANPPPADGDVHFTRRALIAAALLIGLFALVYLFWQVRVWLAVAFLTLIVGATLRTAARWVTDNSKLPAKAGVLGLAGLLVLLVAAAGYLAYDGLTKQLPDNLQAAVDGLRERIDGSMVDVALPEESLPEELPEALGGPATQEAPPPPQQAAQASTPEERGEGQLPVGFDIRSTLSRALGVLSSVVTLVGGAALVAVTGVYLALEPRLYINGGVRLAPPRHRPRLRETLVEVGHTLAAWTMGQLLNMTILGTLTGIGLWLLGVPLPLTLGILTGLLCFIPNFGPVLSVIPPILLALGTGDGGPALAGWVILLYLGIQTLESYLLTPMIQKQAVDMPPALLIIAQVIGGALIGALGVLLAAPFVAAAMVVVKRLYIENVLGDEEPAAE